MGNGISSDYVPKVSWEILHNEIQLLGEDEEIGLDDHENGFANFKRCRKSRGHIHMTPIILEPWTQLPQEWRNPEMINSIAKQAAQTVKITLPYISKERPVGYPLHKYRGSRLRCVGSGFAYVDAFLFHQAPIDCPIAGCERGPCNHKVTPMFEVYTNKHVVFDNTEAKLVRVEFFLDRNRHDSSSVVEGQGVDVLASSGSIGDRCEFRVVSHDLDLFKKVTLYTIACSLWARRSLLSHSRPISETEKKSHLVFVTSHPHGLPKHVSFGELVDIGERMTDIDDRKLVDWFKAIEFTTPDWRETGVTRPIGGYISPERIMELVTVIRDDPTITLRQYSQRKTKCLSVEPFVSMSYTAATCHGSSGAKVIVLPMRDGEVSGGMAAHHSSGSGRSVGDRHVNISGGGCGARSSFEFLHSICEEKMKN